MSSTKCTVCLRTLSPSALTQAEGVTIIPLNKLVLTIAPCLVCIYVLVSISVFILIFSSLFVFVSIYVFIVVPCPCPCPYLMLN
jgi:hypothetical protein